MQLTAEASGVAGARSSALRLIAGAAAGALWLTVAVASPGAAMATAQPSPTPPADEGQVEVPEAVPGEEVCAIADPRLTEISGMAATADGYIVVNDSQDFDDTRRPIFFLDSACAVFDEQSFLPGQPRDPEGIELSGDGTTLWIGDIGDNAAGGGEGEPRPSVALWRVDLSGGDRTPLIHRFTYPDNEPRDAEALLLDGNGTPIIVTKELGKAGLYVPTEVVPSDAPEQTVPLELVGEFSPPETGTENPFLAAGQQVITGGAVSPDGSRVVLRTYADAFEFDVADGDVVAAITAGEPRVTPLPDEPQGEAITYSADGAQFLTVPEILDPGLSAASVLSYTPTEPAPPPPPTQPPAAAESSGGGGSLFNSVQDIINVIAAVGVIGLILVAAGVFGIVRARRRAAGATGDGGDEDPDGGDGEPLGSPVSGRARPPSQPEPGWEPEPAGRVQAAAGVYTSSRAVAGGEPGGGYGGVQEYPETEYQGTEYGSPNGGAEQGGAVYGGGQYGGGEYRGGEYAAGEYGGGHAGGEYRGGEYAGGGYRGGEYAASEYGGPEYGAPEYGAAEYGAAENGGGGHAGGSYRGGEYAGGEYRGGYAPGGHSDQPYDQAWSEGDTGRDGYAVPHQGNGAAPAQPAPDYYSDDPDYPYEFRERRRW